MNRFALVLVNGVVQEMPINDRIEHSANIPRQANAPSPAVSGDQWFDTSTSRFMLYDGSQWTTVGGDNASAIATANQALAATADVYKEVANVAAISASPANGDKIELLDSTGVQSFSPLSGLPSGFVGASNLLVRLEYNSSGSSWEFRSFASKDPDGRYLKSLSPVVLGDSGSGSGSITLNCETNAHGVKLKGPAHSAAANYTLTLPDDAGTAGQILQTSGSSGNLSWVTNDSNEIVLGSSGKVELKLNSLNDDSLETTLENIEVRRDLHTHSFINTNQFFSGDIEIRGDKTFAFQQNSGGGGPFTAFKKSQSATTSATFTLPDADGSAGQAVITDGSGVLSFGNVGGQFVETPQTLTENKVIAANINASCNGPIALDSGVTVTVGSNSSLAIRN